MLKVLFAIKNNVQGAMQYIFQFVSKQCGRGLPNFLNTKTAQVVPILNDLISKTLSQRQEPCP